MSLHLVRISCDDTTGRLLQLLVTLTPDRIVGDELDVQARPSYLSPASAAGYSSSSSRSAAAVGR